MGQVVTVNKLSKWGAIGNKMHKTCGEKPVTQGQAQAKPKQGKWCGGPQFWKRDECPAKENK